MGTRWEEARSGVRRTRPANHTQETEAQFNTVDTLQALLCAAMEDNEAMVNLAIINLILSHILNEAQ